MKKALIIVLSLFGYSLSMFLGLGIKTQAELMDTSRSKGGRHFVQPEDNLFMTDLIHVQGLSAVFFIFPTLLIVSAFICFFKAEYRKYVPFLIILPLTINAIFAVAMYWEWSNLELNNIPSMSEIMTQIEM